MKIKTSEAEVKKAVKEYLDAKKYLYIPIQNQGTWDPVKEVRRKFPGTRGAPDFMVFIPETNWVGAEFKSAEWICIELKSTTGKQSKYQKDFEHKVDVDGGRYFVVRSIDDLVEAGL